MIKKDYKSINRYLRLLASNKTIEYLLYSHFKRTHYEFFLFYLLKFTLYNYVKEETSEIKKSGVPFNVFNVYKELKRSLNEALTIQKR